MRNENGGSKDRRDIDMSNGDLENGSATLVRQILSRAISLNWSESISRSAGEIVENYPPAEY